MDVQQQLDANFAALQEENRRLRRAVEELSVLNDLARAISASLNPEEIMGTIIRRSLRAVNAEQGVITLVDKKAADPSRTLVRAMVSSSQHEQFHLNQALLGWMHLNKKPLHINDPRVDERFRGVRWDESIRNLLCVPLIVKGELTGVLTVYNKKTGSAFADDDLRLLAIIGGQSAQVMENARLNEHEKLFLKMQEEVRLAARIQSDLLPSTMPEIPGYEIAGKNIPAQEVGGDHFDFIPIDENRLAICLGDVSGKGLPASLLMSNLQATLRSQTFVSPTPAECVQRSNTLLFRTTSSEKFVTLFYCVLDYKQHRLTFTNAGHDFPFLISKNGTIRRLETGGIAVGMLDGFSYQEETVELAGDDLLVIYSDGIAEAMNTDRSQYGDERLGQLLLTHSGKSAAGVLEEIIGDVRTHVGTAPQMDDITLVTVKRTA
jgi:sigma-B regulation protein RsbU (phosphoserine phosphatase)